MRVLAGPIVVLVVAAITATAVTFSPPINIVTGASEFLVHDAVPLDGATSAAIDISLDAGELWFGGGTMASGTVVGRSELIQGRFELESETPPTLDYELSENGREGRLSIRPSESESVWSWSEPDQRWSIFVNPTVPTRLSVLVGTGDTELVVGGMRLSNLRLETGAGDVTLDLSGDWQTNLDATLDVGVGDITILAPKELGVRIATDQGVGEVETTDFAARDGAYVNQAYGRTAYQLEVNIVQGAGDIEIIAQ